MTKRIFSSLAVLALVAVASVAVASVGMSEARAGPSPGSLEDFGDQGDVYNVHATYFSAGGAEALSGCSLQDRDDIGAVVLNRSSRGADDIGARLLTSSLGVSADLTRQEVASPPVGAV
jgi:hypothetical protein